MMKEDQEICLQMVKQRRLC